MDIDSPPAALPELAHDPHYGHNHVTLPPFSASFPLPFRVLFLVGLAILLWGTNLHILHILGLDTAWILDFRETDDKAVPLEVISHEDVGDVPPPRATRIASPTNRPTSKGLYAPVYKLFLAYTTWVGGGWLVFRVITGGDTARMEEWRALVGVIMVGAAVGVVAPWQGLGWRERTALRRSGVSHTCEVTLMLVQSCQANPRAFPDGSHLLLGCHPRGYPYVLCQGSW